MKCYVLNYDKIKYADITKSQSFITYTRKGMAARDAPLKAKQHHSGFPRVRGVVWTRCAEWGGQWASMGCGCDAASKVV